MAFTRTRRALQENAQVIVRELRQTMIERSTFVRPQTLSDIRAGELEVRAEQTAGGRFGEIAFDIELPILVPAAVRFKDSGRRPGKQPPPQTIRDWVAGLGIQFQDRRGRFLSFNTTAFLIGRAIGRRGIPPTPIVQPSLDTVRAENNQRLRTAIAADLRGIFRDILIREARTGARP